MAGLGDLVLGAYRQTGAPELLRTLITLRLAALEAAPSTVRMIGLADAYFDLCRHSTAAALQALSWLLAAEATGKMCNAKVILLFKQLDRGTEAEQYASECSERAPPMYVNFYALAPHAHIIPHLGNDLRLTIHLALEVPPQNQSYIRVGDETFNYTHAGQMLVFDDAYDHEVWNQAATTRLVLGITIWHPELLRRHVMKPSFVPSGFELDGDATVLQAFQAVACVQRGREKSPYVAFRDQFKAYRQNGKTVECVMRQKRLPTSFKVLLEGIYEGPEGESMLIADVEARLTQVPEGDPQDVELWKRSVAVSCFRELGFLKRGV
ncbi:unnamed protein product [Effrenium voratum]|nr:unnamed protein product [Effrenium voratum]